MKLLEHQKSALVTLKRFENIGKGGILADECGLGKTVTMAAHMMTNKIEGKPDLIVCPLSLIKHWEREINKVYRCEDFVNTQAETKHPNICIYHGSRRSALIKTIGKADYVITTYSLLGSTKLKELKIKEWGRVVLDESHTIRNGVQRKKVKSALGAYHVGKKSEFNWCMSATPFMNNVKDLVSQCKFIGTDPYSDPKWWKTNRNNSDAMEDWSNNNMLRRKKADVLEDNIPVPIYHDFNIEPFETEKRLVDSLREQASDQFNQWKSSFGLDRIQLQGKILALIQKLRLVSNSFYCGENLTEEMLDNILEENAKVNKIIETLDRKIWEDPAKKVVIFSQFTSFLDILKVVIKKYLHGVNVYMFSGSMSIKKREKTIKKFTSTKDDKPSIILVSLLAGAEGINLLPCSTLFLCEPYYTPFIEKQAEERVHRIGQTSQVNVYRFYINNSVETWINKIKDTKKQSAQMFGLESIDSSNGRSNFSFSSLSGLFTDMVSFRSAGSRNNNVYPSSTPKPEVVYSNEDVSEGSTFTREKMGIDCCICLEDCGMKRSCNLTCGHIFHIECLNKWREYNDNCPTCQSLIHI